MIGTGYVTGVPANTGPTVAARLDGTEDGIGVGDMNVDVGEGSTAVKVGDGSSGTIEGVRVGSTETGGGIGVSVAGVAGLALVV